VSLTSDLLAPGGGLARAIPHYEDRAEQRAMSAAVARALAPDGGRPLIVEAGTGTGKTLAYLVPALQSGKRVIVSTGTRALQDQIARHDIPLLRELVGRPFTAVVLMGVGNYF
jgi:ATP-dependent DNA helicase DinG